VQITLYKIVAEYKAFLVIDKQPETSIHNEGGDFNNGSTAAKKVGLIQQLRLDFNTPHIYPVHRLDKPTSGLLLCAKTPEANSQLSQLFQNKQVEKYYLAISNHKPKKKQGLIAGGMERTRNGNWKLTTSTIRPAITQFFSYGLGEGKRLFILKPYTGKTHQLRVALKSIGSPIMGDTRYAPTKHHSERTHLHAYCLRFRYAETDYHFQSLPSGGDFNEEFIGLVENNLHEPWTLSWPTLPKKFLVDNNIKKVVL
jgi:tRNA pseudouridine32 synthase/23S rRNA pseudouridine746 synthase